MTTDSNPPSIAALTIRVAVGSKNPCKIEAVRKAFEDVFVWNSKAATNDVVTEQDERPVKIVVSSYDVPSGKIRSYVYKLGLFVCCLAYPKILLISTYNLPCIGVSDQPFGDAETREGAMNRAKAAYVDACADINSEDDNQYPDFAVGLDGGLKEQYHPQTESERQNQQNMTEEL